MESPVAAPSWLSPPEDETLARSALVGTLTHMVITRLLSRHDEDPGWQRALHEADRLLCPPLVENRAHRQAIAGAAMAYFRVLRPPPAWVFAGAEPSIGGPRPDVLWQNAQRDLLLDEIKTGRGPSDLQEAHRQALRYVDAAADAYGSRVRGVRLVFTADPAASWLLRPDHSIVPLQMTPYLRDRNHRLRRPPRISSLDGAAARPRAPPTHG